MEKERCIPMNDINYKNKKLQFSHADIETIAKKHKTPFFVYSEEILKHNFETFANGAKVAGLIDPVVFFSLK
jgi:diaminopimelate decarboxylase